MGEEGEGLAFKGEGLAFKGGLWGRVELVGF